MVGGTGLEPASLRVYGISDAPAVLEETELQRLRRGITRLLEFGPADHRLDRPDRAITARSP